MDGLRRQIQPVTPDVFLRFLTEHHGLAKNSQRAGSDGLFEVISILQGIDLAAASWEESVLPSRVRGYRPEWLDELCLTGEVGWGRLFPPKKEREAPASLSKIVPVSIFLRSDAKWLAAKTSVPSPLGGEGGRRPDEGGLGSGVGTPTVARGTPSPALRAPSPPEGGEGTDDGEPKTHPVSAAARRVAVTLASRGAMFATDLMAQCELARGELNQALGELIALGVVTADGFGGLRDLSGGRKATRSGAVLKPGLVRQRHSAGGTGRWTLTELGARSATVPSPLRGEGARRAGEGEERIVSDTPDSTPPSSSLRPPSSPRGGGTVVSSRNKSDAIEQWAWQLLRRWGVVFRDLLDRESGAPRWWGLLQVFRRLEARGEIRGGRFISGVAGEQFGLGETVRKLRQLRDEASRPQTRTRTLRHSFLDAMRSGEPADEETSSRDGNSDREEESFRVVALPGGVVEERLTGAQVRPEPKPVGRQPELLVLSAADPLNLIGIVTRHARVPSVAHNRIVLLDGRPVAAIQNGELVMLDEVPPAQLRELQRLLGSDVAVVQPTPGVPVTSATRTEGQEPERPAVSEVDEPKPVEEETPARGRRRFRPIIT